MKTILGLLAAGAVSMTAASFATAAENVPYFVPGNTHMLIGVSYDAAALDEILPEGLEAAEENSGGTQVYTSDGGEGVAPYTCTYALVDLVN